ncbi:esterase-like activity of phytase family protein [Acidovorax sp. DW039]|uniref:esterase-like activity of phytase family protein n=1 Tax=Acidovorax sp. DW039 TaxID=3095606 RepID=UPI00308BE612|nr:esterase-like activity of phytase family protein [Acidovorax sp. DW039]
MPATCIQRLQRATPARWLVSAMLVAGLLTLSGCAAPLQPSTAATTSTSPHAPQANGIRLLAQAHIPAGTDVLGSRFGGISGVDYDARSGQFWLISDDRATLGPVRMYTARWALANALTSSPQITGMVVLQGDGGQPFPAPRRGGASAQGGTHSPDTSPETPDAEALRWHPSGHSLWWTSEGDPSRSIGPRLREALPDGRWARTLALPPAFEPSQPATPPHQRSGPRNNASLEGLTFSADGCTAWLAMEMAWHQDGPRPTVQAPGGPVRITALNATTGQAQQQRAYLPDAVPHARRLPWGPEVNGVSEILADGPHHLLVLERSYSAGAGFGARLYRVDLRTGSDTLTLPALQPGNYTPLQKSLLLDFATLGLGTVDNLEGMTWAEPLPSGERVLVLVSDDNFNPAQSTQWLALAVPASGENDGVNPAAAGGERGPSSPTSQPSPCGAALPVKEPA